MAKPTGFMEFERRDHAYAPVKERLKHYREFAEPLPPDELKRQAGRCMDCGTPYCHAACPVNNIIPDWNDLVYEGDMRRALEVLHSTNNFPDITGRICPARCEASCTLNLIESPVTIKTIEHAIAERGWEAGWVAPSPAKHRTGKRVAVVGSGEAILKGRAMAQKSNGGFAARTVAENPAVIEETWREQLKTDPRVRYYDLMACTRADLREELGRIDRPALVMSGQEDPITTPADAEFIASRIP